MHVGCRFEMPREIMTKRAMINVRSMDNAYFMVGGRRFVLSRKKRGSQIFLSTLYDGAEFPKYRISYNVKKCHEIRTSQQCVRLLMYKYRGTENAKHFPDDSLTTKRRNISI